MTLTNDNSTAGPSTLHVLSEPEPELEQIETLVSRRSRRSTAGNRMEAALAEMASMNPEATEEVDEDVDFVITRDEEDVFESDFASTDDEDENRMDEVGGDKEVQEEERAARKSARKAVERQTALAHERQKATFNPTAVKRVRIVPPPAESVQSRSQKTDGIRQSRRKSAIKKRGEIAKRIKESEQRRASIKLRKSLSSQSSNKQTQFTQAELIQRALDNEEGNIYSHRTYLQREEEKRRKATTIRRQAVEGKRLRWISRIEETEVEVPAAWGNPSLVPQEIPNPTQPIYKKEKVTKNYLVHELSQDGEYRPPKPKWRETMSAVFGDHVEWNKLQVLASESVTTRPSATCPLTGRPAPYRDPRTNIPFVDVNGYRALTDLLEEKSEHMWCPEAECWVGRVDDIEMVVEPEDALMIC